VKTTTNHRIPHEAGNFFSSRRNISLSGGFVELDSSLANYYTVKYFTLCLQASLTVDLQHII